MGVDAIPIMIEPIRNRKSDLSLVEPMIGVSYPIVVPIIG